MLPSSLKKRNNPHTFIPITPPFLPPSPPITIPVSPAWDCSVDQLLIEIISKRHSINAETVQKIMRLINAEPAPITRNNTVFFKQDDYILRD